MAGRRSGPAAAIVVDGSSTVYRISMAARDSFNNHRTHHGRRRRLSRHRGRLQQVHGGRDRHRRRLEGGQAGEEAKAKAQGIDWSRFLVGYDGITLVVNPKNDFVKSLSVEQLKTLWEPASKVMNWKDLDSAWPDRKIILYSPDDDSGTFEFFTEAIVGKIEEPARGRADELG